MKKLMLILLVTCNAFACIGHEGANCRESLPAGDAQKMYEEIHGNGVYPTSFNPIAQRKAEKFAADADTTYAMAEYVNDNYRGMFKIAAMNLRKYGFKKESREVLNEWREHDGELNYLVALDRRAIADFAPLSQWIDKAYQKICGEQALGYNICYALRLSDIYSVNHELIPFFSMCSYTPVQTIDVGCGDFHMTPVPIHPVRGLEDITIYWSVVIGCDVITYGSGLIFPICSPIGMITERIFELKLCEPLTNKIYGWACK